MPIRIQRRRVAGWRMPQNAVYVGRPTKWGNPFAVGGTKHVGPSYSGRDETIMDSAHAARLFRTHMFNLRSASELVAPLRGRDLACWCRLCDVHAAGKPLGSDCADCEPCHADVLLALANVDQVVSA